MFGRKSVNLDGALYEKAKRCAEKAGYASVDEFVKHLIELEAAKLEESEEQEAIQRRLKGLGYV